MGQVNGDRSTAMGGESVKQYDFDRVIDRLDSDSAKWQRYGSDVLPLWVADMDFEAPQPVTEALQQRVAHGIFGYGVEPAQLRQVIIERLHRLYDWQVSPESLVFLPGVVTGFNMACHAFCEPGDGVLVQEPVYGPMLTAPTNAGLCCQTMNLTYQENGTYTIDNAAFEHAIDERTRLFMPCNPHNPVGRVFTPEELTGMAEICLRHDLVICSDEIHAELIFSGQRHIPIASLSPEIEDRTITLIAPSKTFNIAGLKCSVAVVPNEKLREQFVQGKQGLVPSVNILGYVAALSAYRDGQPWLDQVMAYIEENRDLTHQFVSEELSGVKMALPEGTYLAWLDCRELALDTSPYAFFIERAKLALNDGTFFGPTGAGFVRLNFACPRTTLMEGLGRMRDALQELA